MDSVVKDLAQAMSHPAHNARRFAAVTLGDIAREGTDMAAAIPALTKALSDGDKDVRETAAWALGHAIENCASIKKLNRMETMLWGERGALMGKCRHGLEWEFARIGMAFSGLMNEIAKRRNALAARRDIMLKDKTKPPKAGRVYRQMGRALAHV
jgi:hypothetical protein